MRTCVTDTPLFVQPQMTLGEWEALQKEKRLATKREAKAPAASKEDFSNMTAFTRKDRTAGDEVLKLSTQKPGKAATKAPERERKAVRAHLAI